MQYDVRWFELDELNTITVYPNELRDNFGLDQNKIYLGRQVD
jgi:hypothetical protein